LDACNPDVIATSSGQDEIDAWLLTGNRSVNGVPFRCR